MRAGFIRLSPVFLHPLVLAQARTQEPRVWRLPPLGPRLREDERMKGERTLPAVLKNKADFPAGLSG